MKLLRYGPSGQEKPGLLDRDGKIRDLSGTVRDIDGEALSPSSLDRLRRLDPASLPLVAGSPRLGPCVGRISKVLAIGLNYRLHAQEAGMPIPKEPIFFLKAVSSICGPNDDVIIPKGSEKTDYEVELGIVIGTKASYVAVHDAPKHIAGYCVVNDVSEREYQLERGGNWMKGKSCPTFGPLGPWLVTPDEIPDVQNLDMWLDVSGQRMQTGSTKTMIFDVKKIVSYVSHFMTLDPGDIIITGTPPGVGAGMKPPRFLKEGDTVALWMDKLGEQKAKVVGWTKPN
jgi:2-keto-4-pentenoate hydratase/2-oxohepta-3-ene-1,7-dioic acid hydratase in catechol pathway